MLLDLRGHPLRVVNTLRNEEKATEAVIEEEAAVGGVVVLMAEDRR